MNNSQKKREQKRAARSLRSKQKKKERKKARHKLLYRSGQDEEDQQEFPEVLDLGTSKHLTQAGKIIPKSKAFETQKGNK